jgi:hypothetical protein
VEETQTFELKENDSKTLFEGNASRQGRQSCPILSLRYSNIVGRKNRRVSSIKFL